MGRRNVDPFRMLNFSRTGASSESPPEQEEAGVDSFVADAIERAHPLQPLDLEVQRRHLAAIVQLAVQVDPAPQLQAVGAASPPTQGNAWPLPRKVAHLMPGLGRAASVVAAAVMLLGGAALAGMLPEPIQEAVARLGSHVGVDFPGGSNEEGRADDQQPPASPGPEDDEGDRTGREEKGSRENDASGKSSSGLGGSKSDDRRDRSEDRAEAEGERDEDRTEDERERDEEAGDETEDRTEDERERDEARDKADDNEDDDDDDDEKENDDDDDDDDD
ncbi:hypothetical protein BH20ACT23_BH20ACT23_25570 [soil metagenome]